MKKIVSMLIGGALATGILALTGCGGGGGGGGGPTSTPVAVKFRAYSSTIATFSNHSGIRSVGMRVDLPVGVTVATDPLDAKLTAKGALQFSGVLTTTFKNITSLASPKPLQVGYSSAKPAGSGKDVVWINLVFPPTKYFDKGEFLTLHCTAAPGASAASSSFALSEKLIEGDLIGTTSNNLTGMYKLGLF